MTIKELYARRCEMKTREDAVRMAVMSTNGTTSAPARARAGVRFSSWISETLAQLSLMGRYSHDHTNYHGGEHHDVRRINCSSTRRFEDC